MLQSQFSTLGGAYRRTRPDEFATVRLVDIGQGSARMQHEWIEDHASQSAVSLHLPASPSLAFPGGLQVVLRVADVGHPRISRSSGRETLHAKPVQYARRTGMLRLRTALLTQGIRCPRIGQLSSYRPEQNDGILYHLTKMLVKKQFPKASTLIYA